MNVNVRVRNGIALGRKQGFYREGMESKESMWTKKEEEEESTGKKRAFSSLTGFTRQLSLSRPASIYSLSLLIFAIYLFSLS